MTDTTFLIVDTESIPDGRLLRAVKYPELTITEEEAIEKARVEASELSYTGSDFIPVTFQVPVAVCVARVSRDYSLTKITCLDAPQFRPREIVRQFWKGLELVNGKIVTFNGRGFDLPLLELAAFRYGIAAKQYYLSRGSRYNSNSLDLQEFFSNFGACRMNGGLNLLAKMLGLPGKMGVSGDQVYEMFRAGRYQDINDYCMFDTLDTYIIFLRTRAMIGDITADREAELIGQARDFLAGKVDEHPALRGYLDNWKVNEPWP